MTAYNKIRSQVESPDQALILVPFQFTINGTSNPLVANNVGDDMVGVQVTRVSAGKFSFTLRHTAIALIDADVHVMVAADSTDIYAQFASYAPLTGACVVRTLTAAVQTDPPNGSIVSGWILVKPSARRAST